MFWDLSFKEHQAIATGAARQLKRKRNDQMSLAWHTATFHRAKKIPRLDQVIDEPKRPAGAMSPDHLQAAVAGWLKNRKR